MKGIIVKVTGKLYNVQDLNMRIITCQLRGKFRQKNIKSTNPIVVGDIVSMVQENGTWVINQLYKRKNFIVRKSVKLSRQTHILAANIDQAVFIFTLKEPVTSLAFMDRFLAACESCSIPVLILLNKSDIYDEATTRKQKEIETLYTEIGYTCLKTSFLSHNSLDITHHLKGKTNVVAGHSGTGKSTLINSLQSHLQIPTNSISSSHKQGRHTTTFSEYYNLDFGGAIIDTPGIKGFGLVDIKEGDLDSCFKEIFELKNRCKFHNCLHMNEPECEIKEAVLDKRISQTRYSNYLSMLNDDTLYRL
tara:strand:- start:1208 stop:2122 length:915 start_codon:yes stop_codon:yes gene_type:complete